MSEDIIFEDTSVDPVKEATGTKHLKTSKKQDHGTRGNTKTKGEYYKARQRHTVKKHRETGKEIDRRNKGAIVENNDASDISVVSSKNGKPEVVYSTKVEDQLNNNGHSEPEFLVDQVPVVSREVAKIIKAKNRKVKYFGKNR